MTVDISKLLEEINKLGYSMTNSNDVMRIDKMIKYSSRYSLNGYKRLLI